MEVFAIITSSMKLLGCEDKPNSTADVLVATNDIATIPKSSEALVVGASTVCALSLDLQLL